MLATMSAPVAVLDPAITPTSPTLKRLPKARNARLDRFTSKVKDRLTRPLTPEVMQLISSKLLSENEEACNSSKIGMLPSFCHTLPSGQERGVYLAVDVGGSTLRVGLIQLNGRSPPNEALTVLKSQHHVIDEPVRSLVGRAFFEWMANRISETLEGNSRCAYDDKPLKIGLAWSFPVE